MSQIFTVDSIDEGVKLATKFKEEGRYKFFRGQVNASWKMQSTSVRKLKTQQGFTEYQKAIFRFFRFCERHPSLNYLTKGEFADHCFAIMQHYGIPTQYIDFTKDPEIAGFFASDGSEIPDGQLSCIICLSDIDIGDIDSLFEETKQENNLPENFLIEIDVSNLWRLQAQQGVFLFMPCDDIEEYIPLDRIVFPHHEFLRLPRDKIYPKRKSNLELLLDSYFDNENKLVSSREIKKWFEEIARNNPNASYLETNDPLENMNANLMPGAEMHFSWKDTDLKNWNQLPVEQWKDVQSNEHYNIKIDLAASFQDSCKSIISKINADIQNGILSRSQLVNFRIVEERDKLNIELHEYLDKCVHRLWDGVRFLPYTDMEVSSMLASVIQIFINAHNAAMNGVSDLDSSAEKLYQNVLAEEYIKIEMGGLIRADSSRALASEHYLAEAFREDLKEIVAPKHKKIAMESNQHVKLFLQIIPDPKWLYDFNKLKKIFIKEIIPTQIVLRVRNDENPIFYNPFQLSVLGLA